MFGATAVTTLALCSSAMAVAITGEVSFLGRGTLDNSLLGSATKVTGWAGPGAVANPVAFGPTLALDIFINPGDEATFAAPWSFNSGPVAGLWSVGGFTFDLTSSTIQLQNSQFLNVTGTGILRGNGYDPTPGKWVFTIADADGSPNTDLKFGFVANTNAVPDGGTSFALLGVSLLGLHGIRRRLKA